MSSTFTTPAGSPGPGEPEPARPSRPYLHQVNLFRILTFACVILVHVIDRTNDPESVAANGVMVLLHFPREAFFTLTGFVLVYQYADRAFDHQHFWRRRFTLVGIPYVIWSVFYWGYSIVDDIHQETATQAVGRLLVELATGEAWYQLYFLLVSMQIYLLFPLIMRLVRRTVGYHGWILGASAAVQLFMLWALSDRPDGLGVVTGWMWDHLYVTILAYQFYALLGAIAAWHIGKVDRAVRRFGPLLVVGAIVGGAFAQWCYHRAVAGGMVAWQANNVFNPYMAVYFLTLIAGLYAISTWWARLQPHYRPVAAISRYGADRSFAVFLVHPIVLELFVPTYPKLYHEIGAVWACVVIFLGVLVVTLLICDLIRRAPGSIWLTGRPRLQGPTPLGRWLRTQLGQTAIAERLDRDSAHHATLGSTPDPGEQSSADLLREQPKRRDLP